MKNISLFAALLILAAFFTVPSLVAAQTNCDLYGCYNADGSLITTSAPGGSGSVNPTYLQGYKDSIIWVINYILVPVLFAIAFITFLWGVYKYFILGADNDTERATGRQFILWGIIGFVIITSVWGLVNLVSGTLGLPSGNRPVPPML